MKTSSGSMLLVLKQHGKTEWNWITGLSCFLQVYKDLDPLTRGKSGIFVVH